MKINGLKLWIDTEIHPDNISNPTYDEIQKIPGFDESYADDETLLVAFWLDHPTQIPEVEKALAVMLGVLL